MYDMISPPTTYIAWVLTLVVILSGTFLKDACNILLSKLLDVTNSSYSYLTSVDNLNSAILPGGFLSNPKMAKATFLLCHFVGQMGLETLASGQMVERTARSGRSPTAMSTESGPA